MFYTYPSDILLINVIQHFRVKTILTKWYEGALNNRNHTLRKFTEHIGVRLIDTYGIIHHASKNNILFKTICKNEKYA
jgi:hypothetical protein